MDPTHIASDLLRTGSCLLFRLGTRCFYHGLVPQHGIAANVLLLKKEIWGGSTSSLSWLLFEGRRNPSAGGDSSPCAHQLLSPTNQHKRLLVSVFLWKIFPDPRIKYSDLSLRFYHLFCFLPCFSNIYWTLAIVASSLSSVFLWVSICSCVWDGGCCCLYGQVAQISLSMNCLKWGTAVSQIHSYLTYKIPKFFGTVCS